jgi:hypothetical protein
MRTSDGCLQFESPSGGQSEAALHLPYTLWCNSNVERAAFFGLGSITRAEVTGRALLSSATGAAVGSDLDMPEVIGASGAIIKHQPVLNLSSSQHSD